VKYTVGGDYHKTEKEEYLSGRSTIEFKGIDNKVGVKEIRYEIPKQKGYVKKAIREVYSSPFRFPQRNGRVQFSYFAKDKLNNTSKTVNHSMIMDLVPPKISLFKLKGEQHFMRSIHYIRKTTKLIFSITDQSSGVQYFNYQIDQGDPQKHSSKKPIHVLSEGPHTLSLKGADYVNNESQLNILVHVDEIPPTITEIYSISPIEEDTKQKSYPTDTTLYLAANDKQSGVKWLFYKLNKQKEQLYQTPLLFKKPGNYTISIRVVDNVGNTTKKEIQFRIIKS